MFLWIFVLIAITALVFFVIPAQAYADTRQDKIYKIATAYGVDPELAIAIIDCEGERYKESGNHKNLDKNGNVWSTDIGWFQINNYYNEEPARRLGIDIYTETGNLVYGIWMLKTQGTKPWIASRSCWKKLV